MKQLIKFTTLSGLLASSAVFAINNPVQGFYAGLLAGISHGPSNSRVAFREEPPAYPGGRILFTGTVTHSSIGAGGGGVLGYKLNHFRLEAEMLYNRFSTGPLRVDPGGCVLESPNILTPTDQCPVGEYDRFRAKGTGYRGSSAATYGIANLYYDFFTPHSDTEVVPYVALGIGVAQIRNFSDFVNTNPNHLFSHGVIETFTTPVIQGIAGLSYMMDDFTWIGMDLRYTTTKSLIERGDWRYNLNDATTEGRNRRYGLMALMFNINFAFDKGGIDC